MYGGGVLVERHVYFEDGELVGSPLGFGDGGIWEALPDFSGSSDAVSLMWACGQEGLQSKHYFKLFGVAPPLEVDQQ